MKFLSGRFFSLLLLLLFLTPLIGTELHTLHHWDDTHCLETGTHFHTTEHHCNLCDFLLPIGTDHCSSHDQLAVNAGNTTVISCVIPDAIFSAPDFYFSLRAPPSII
jgi:hypothetical protein